MSRGKRLRLRVLHEENFVRRYCGGRADRVPEHGATNTDDAGSRTGAEMTETTKQRAPGGLQTAGRALWSKITGTYLLDPRELEVLTHACRQADDLAALEESIAEHGRRIDTPNGPRLNSAIPEARLAR